MTRRVDVVVVAYHSGAVIDRSLEAIAAFAPPGTRIIVVDNSPDDPSAAAAVERTPGAELLSEPRNVGFAAAVNDGLRRGSADLILLANPDVSSIEGSFEAVERIFAASADVAAVAVHLSDSNGGIERCRRAPRPIDFLDYSVGIRRFLPKRLAGPPNYLLDWDHASERTVDIATGALLFLRRSAIHDVGELDERFFVYWEETDWLIRAGQRAQRLVFTPEVRGVHVGRQSSDVAHAPHSLLFLANGDRYARKHFGLATATLLRLTWIAADAARLAVSPLRSSTDRREVAGRLRLHLGLTRTPGPRGV